ncbi:alpha/beta hydrolase family protein [Streptomyces albidochromogenes]|uniref:alpha/beta hydrolase n=1 Tax=Streptomyces albidochromogenes TaxID=329524 RepID=UPI00110FDFDE|nr:alpha/beta hydrolase [Streptomyces albidochromogenes]
MASRPRSSRPRRTLIAALVIASVAVPVSGAARPAAVPAPAPAVLAPLSAATPAALAERYAANRDGIRAAERAATGHGDHRRAAALRAMADPARHFLTFDGRDGGRTAEVFGDLSRAERIAVLVPGSDTSLDRYGRLRAGAAALQRELGARSAVVAWLGYKTPGTVSPEVLTPGRAEDAAPALRRFVTELRAAAPAARTSLLCHSYGSVVCGRAAPGLGAGDVEDIVLFGSPGAGGDTAATLGSRATVWAGRGAGDWIADVPHGRLQLPFTTAGLGADPMSPEFGARLFAAGDGGHSDYLKPGSPALENIARIVSGRALSGSEEGERRA